MSKRLSLRSSWQAKETMRELVSKHEPWQNSTGTFRGVTEFEGYGRLPAELHEACRKANYWIYSYATPIAWADGHLVKPAEKYSVTTSRHQGMIW